MKTQYVIMNIRLLEIGQTVPLFLSTYIRKITKLSEFVILNIISFSGSFKHPSLHSMKSTLLFPFPQGSLKQEGFHT